VSQPQQLSFTLPHRPALGREDFLVAPANELAVAWVDAWPQWPQPALVLIGPPGSGKTHLAQVWRAASGAVAAEPEALSELDPPELLGAAGAACLVDDADRMLADAAERTAAERRLLHLYNVLRERRGHLLLTARTPPRQWALQVPDLRSRLTAATGVELGSPDDALIQAVLVKLFADRQLRVGPEVVQFLWPRMERSFEAARRLVDALDAASLADRREITVPLARRVLARLQDDTDANDNSREEPSHGPGTEG